MHTAPARISVTERLHTAAAAAGIAPAALEHMTFVEFAGAVAQAHEATVAEENLGHVVAALTECLAGAAGLSTAEPLPLDTKAELVTALTEIRNAVAHLLATATVSRLGR